MGQRTQILVIREKRNGERNARFYHHQWGFGRNMYHAVMDAQLCDYNKEISYGNDFDFFKLKDFGTFERLHDITDGVPDNVLSNVNPTDFKTIQEIFKYGDNNNGGCVIYIKQGETNHSGSDFTIGFLLGDEDTYVKDKHGEWVEGPEKAFERWLSPAEYGNKNGGHEYSDPEFIRMFKDFCNYYGIGIFKNS